MLIVALAIVLAPLAWLVIKRMQHADPKARGGRLGWVIACLAAALALRAGLAAPVLLRAALCLLAIAAIAVWLRRRGQGDDGPGDDGRDLPVDPGPDPGSGDRAALPSERLESEAFDRARTDWEHELKKHARHEWRRLTRRAARSAGSQTSTCPARRSERPHDSAACRGDPALRRSDAPSGQGSTCGSCKVGDRRTRRGSVVNRDRAVRLTGCWVGC